MWAVWLAVGLVTGSVLTHVVFRISCGHGVLRIDRTNPEKDIYRLDVGDIDSLSKNKRVVLKIDNGASLYDDSQE